MNLFMKAGMENGDLNAEIRRSNDSWFKGSTLLILHTKAKGLSKCETMKCGYQDNNHTLPTCTYTYVMKLIPSSDDQTPEKVSHPWTI